MGLLRLTGFSGMWPVRDTRALPDNAAVFAENIRCHGGAYLRALHEPRGIRSLNGSTCEIYRLLQPTLNTLDNSYYMQFIDYDTDVVRTPNVNDAFERYYWAGPSIGLKYATKAQILAAFAGYDVGVVAPTAAPTLTVVAGTGHIDPVTGKNDAPFETRSYVVTFIDIYGEESQPSPAVEGTGAIDQDWLLTAIPQPGSPGTRAAYQTIRIYRTVTGLTGVSAFYKVVDLAVGTTFYTDRLSDLFVTGQVGLESTFFSPPPAGLQGVALMPNGILVSWKDNQLYFCENYRPNAWPAEYQITVDYPIVGLGVFGNSCVVCTTGSPSIVSGTKAAALTLTKTDARLPCLSRGSIASAPEGVYYASDAGLVLIGPGGINIVSESLFDRDTWLRDFTPTTFRSIFVAGVYIAILPLSATGFMFKPQNPQEEGVVRWHTVSQLPVNLSVDPWTGRPLFIGQVGAAVNLYEWDEFSQAGMTYMWRSKEFQYPKPCNFSVGQAYFDEGSGTAHLKVWATLRGNDGTFTRTLVYDQNITASGREFRLPSGFKSDIWQVELSGTAIVQSLMLATTVAELRNA